MEGSVTKRRKYRKSSGFLDNVDWTVNPDTLREIAAVIFGIGSIFLLLSSFGIAGKLGIYTINFLYNIFGIFGYLLFILFAFVSYFLWNPEKLEFKATSWIGGILVIVFVPALFSSAGGMVGMAIYGFFKNLLGVIGAFFVLFGASLIGVLLLFNTSLKTLIGMIWPLGGDTVNVHELKGDEAAVNNVSVLTTLKNKFKGYNNHTPQNSSTSKTAVVSKGDDQNWKFPTFDLLELSDNKPTSGNITKNVEVIQKTLKDFNIEVLMGDVNIGPTVTQYTLKPIEGVKLNQIVARQNDLALALAAHPIRIEAPIPGKAAVGIEIPNKVPAIVTIREILETPAFKKSKSNLSFTLGRDVAGNPMVIDLKKMPHLLIAGATGSGKSICVNSIIVSLLYANSPSDLRLVLVDPKRVEFTPYNNIPHLLTPVVVDSDKTVNTLKWAVAEMERRYKLLSEKGSRDIISYNEKNQDERLPYIVVVIDELADLMMKSSKEVEGAIVRIAQMARAVGIHLIIATQRPSVNVITGLIKANVPARISFAVTSGVDSRTIIDQSGAEKLLGRGDMLYVSPEFGKPKRVQGVLVLESEIKKVTDFLKQEGSPMYDEEIQEFGNRASAGNSGGGSQDGNIDDDLYEEAREIVTSSGKASASYLQRRLRIGYARAARLLDLLEEQGVVGPAVGAKPREVLSSSNSGDFPPDDPRLDE